MSIAVTRTTSSPRVAPWLLGFLAAYFLVQTLLRLFVVSSLGVDDAEMVVISQNLAFGYGSQPPLYNWLQAAFFAAFGFGAPAIALLHFLLLFAAYAFTFLAGRIVFASDLKAAGVALALFALPQVGWEALHSHTHTLLALTLSAATLLAMLRVLESGRWADYAILGVCIALGAMSKYNYLLFAAALLIAGASLPATRHRVLSWRMLAAILLALVLLAPHLHWVATHTDETLSRTFKFGLDQESGLLGVWARGVLGFVISVASYLALAVAVFAAAAFFPVLEKADRPADRRTRLPEARAFMVRVLVAALVIVLVVMLASRATEIKERWLQPVLFIGPFVLMVIAEPHLTGFRQRLVVLFSAGIGIAFLIALGVAYLMPAVNGTPMRALAPFERLADDIRNLGFSEGTILASDFYVGGNLRLHIPEAAAAEPEYGLASLPEGAGAPVLLAWPGNRDRPPKPLRVLLETFCGEDVMLPPAETKHFTRRYENARRARYALSVALVPDCPLQAPNLVSNQ